MHTFGKTLLGLLLLIGIAIAPLSCVTVNKTPGSPDQPKNTEVNVGGSHGVTVEHHDTD